MAEEDIKDALDRALRQQASASVRGYHAEARIARALKQQGVPHYRGEELATFDFGFPIHDVEDWHKALGGDSEIHIQKYIKNNGHLKENYALDVKNYSWRGLHAWRRSETNYITARQSYAIKFDSKERKLNKLPDGLILTADESPGHVAIILQDRFFLDTSRSSSWVNQQQYNLFPEILWPYMLHIDDLGVAIDRLRRVIAGEADVYVVPGSGIRHKFRRPKLRDLSFIRRLKTPNPSNWWQGRINSERIIEKLYAQLQALGMGTILTQPLYGDFELLSRRIEHKLASGNYVMRISGLYAEFTDISDYSSPFKSSRLWEFLWVHMGNVVYLIPRDFFGDEFFTGVGTMRVLLSDLERYRFEIDEQGTYVQTVMRIILEYEGQDMRMHPQRLEEQDELDEVVEQDELEEVLVAADDEDIDDFSMPSSGDESEGEETGQRRTKRIILSPSEIPDRWVIKANLPYIFHLLMYYCATRGEGIIFSLPSGSPHGQYMFINYTWPKGAAETFFQSNRPPVQFLELLLQRGRATYGIILRLEHSSMASDALGAIALTSGEIIRANLYGDKNFLCVVATTKDTTNQFGGRTSLSCEGTYNSYRVYPSEVLHIQNNPTIRKQMTLFETSQRMNEPPLVETLLGPNASEDFFVRTQHLHARLLEWTLGNGDAGLASAPFDRFRFDNRPYRYTVQQIVQSLADRHTLRAQVPAVLERWHLKPADSTMSDEAASI